MKTSDTDPHTHAAPKLAVNVKVNVNVNVNASSTSSQLVRWDVCERDPVVRGCHGRL